MYIKYYYENIQEICFTVSHVTGDAEHTAHCGGATAADKYCRLGWLNVTIVPFPLTVLAHYQPFL